ncbi:MAG: hypothetical protein GXO63_01930, partial [Candidatus Micrarchaeota archaeon]|nr:hypothetical protein [Candidatus Micrarchaeota archaeon]
EGPESVSKYLYEYTGDRYYVSDHFKKKMEHFYKWRFYNTIEDRVEDIAMLWAKIKGRSIPVDLKTFGKLCIGFWAPKPFLAYVSRLSNQTR